MKNIAVICEYNPFHKGHKEQIEIIRSIFGPCRIIALMSGAAVQRGEIAVYGKYLRARAAVDCGASLVLEIPYPYCSSCAEIFAEAGVLMAGALGKIDYLVFGSECGDISALKEISNRLRSMEFESEMAKISAIHPEYSYPKKRSLCYKELYGEEITATPNDTLGIEYINAIQKYGLSIEPVTYKRKSGYSAGESRKICRNGGDLSQCIPEQAKCVFEKADPIDMTENFGRNILCFCQMKSVEYFEGVFDVSAELAAKIKKSAAKATCFNELVDFTVSPRFTRARVKRALLYSYAGVVRKPNNCPGFTNLLAADELGLEFLSSIRKSCEIEIVTKTSNYKLLDEKLQREYELSLKADLMFCQASSPMIAAEEIFKTSPYIRKNKTN